MFGLPHPRSCFFEQPQFKCLFGDNLLQVLRLAPERRMSRTSLSAATGVGSDFCLILSSLAATMSLDSSVSQLLKRDTLAECTPGGYIGRCGR
jgi:hypothetical protein